MFETMAFTIWLMAAVLFAIFVFLLIALSCMAVMLRVIFKFLRED